MKVKKIKVPYYKWTVVSIVIESYEEKDLIVKKMHSFKMRPEDIDNVVDMIEKEATGGALCHYNDSKLLCVIITFPHKTTRDLVATLIHEGRHATDRVIDTAGLEGVESAAYLNEYVVIEMISDYIKD